jgi:hypothetical protein
MSRFALYVAAGLYLIAALTTGEPHMRVVLLSYAIANVALTFAV